MKLCFFCVLKHPGNGCRLHDSVALVRIYADGDRAVVVLTEPHFNEGTSVTNSYEQIAARIRDMVTEYIPYANFPDKVVWMEQYEVRPAEIDLVTLQWAERGHRLLAMSPPVWRRLTKETATVYGVPWAELLQPTRLQVLK